MEVARREACEAGREVLRLCVRAWRECADGVRARAAAWEQRWERAGRGSGECALAARLHISDGSLERLWGDERGFMLLVLAYMRLVRADNVMARRKRHAVWWARRATYWRGETGASATDTGAARDAKVSMWRARRDEQHAEQRRRKRQRHAGRVVCTSSSEGVSSDGGGENDCEDDCEVDGEAGSPPRDLGEAEAGGAGGGRTRRTRRTDFVLAFTSQARQALRSVLSTGRRRHAECRCGVG